MKKRRGEGFAYFRWHSLQWDYPCSCGYGDSWSCAREWMQQQRITRPEINVFGRDAKIDDFVVPVNGREPM